MQKFILLASAIGFLNLAQPASLAAQNSVTVKVPRLKKVEGNLHVYLCKDANTFYDKYFQEQIIAINPHGETKVTFANIPTGLYAIRVFQDYDGDSKLETDLMNIPKEPIGFSNNPAIRMGPPTFQKAGFQVSGAVQKTILLFIIDNSIFSSPFKI